MIIWLGTVMLVLNSIDKTTLSFWFFFFFQAEDGIRDYRVTGVQTCALPISAPPNPRARRRAGRRFADRARGVPEPPPVRRRARSGRRAGSRRTSGRSRLRGRSEERRVGEEGRSRWAPDH